MKRYSTIGLCLILLVSLICISQNPVFSAQSTEREVGVKVGDWFYVIHYTIKASDNPEERLPSSDKFLSMRGNTSVIGMSGTNITYQSTTYYKDGTSISRQDWVDIDTGDATHGYGSSIEFVASNLTSGDSLYTIGMTDWIFNETISRTYLGEVRLVNHVNITERFSSTDYDATLSRNAFWDKRTGIFVEGTTETITLNKTSGYKTSETMYWLIIDTNLWGYTKVSAKYNDLVNIYNNLHIDYNDLNTEYDSLNSTYNNLQTSYQSLQSDYNDLNGQYEFLRGESNIVRNLTYIFVATTILLMFTTIYFARRRPKS